jgi:hypothetical protein
VWDTGNCTDPWRLTGTNNHTALKYLSVLPPGKDILRPVNILLQFGTGFVPEL